MVNINKTEELESIHKIIKKTTWFKQEMIKAELKGFQDARAIMNDVLKKEK